jgi:cytidylate kinase
MPTTSERLVEAMAKTRRQWEAHLEAEAATGGGGRSPDHCLIAISREAGANGSRIARAVAARLNWPIYDRELLQRVAQEMGLRAHLLEGMDEKRKGWLTERMEMLFAGKSVSESAYVRHLLETVLSLAAHGQCVVVGRGAPHFLPVTTTLRVRIIASLEDRIENIRHEFGFTREEAARWVEKTDAERSEFVLGHFRRDPADVKQYDLVLNSSRFTVDECVDMIIVALHRLQAHLQPAHAEPATV